MVKLRAPFRPFTFIALALIAASALSCDFLALALPQGAANAAFSYADPRIEKSVRVKGLNQIFNLAVAPDGRVFAIARDGVAEYDSNLNFVRSYYADAAEGIDKGESGYGPQEWQVASGPGGGPVLFATKSGVVLFLFPSAGTIYQKKIFDMSFFAVIQSSVVFDPVAHYPYQESLILAYVPPIRAIGANVAESLLFGIQEDSLSEIGNNLREYNSSLGVFSSWFAPPGVFNPTVSISIPGVRSDFGVHRLYPRTAIIALVMGRNSFIGDVESSTFIYDRALGGEPIARFDMRGAVTAASDSALYAITGDHDESDGWLHKLRWLP
jgi:hypothetical protein